MKCKSADWAVIQGLHNDWRSIADLTNGKASAHLHAYVFGIATGVSSGLALIDQIHTCFSSKKSPNLSVPISDTVCDCHQSLIPLLLNLEFGV